MAKQIKVKLKLQIPAGKATPAPPVGTALGPHGINIGEFVSRFNEGTRDRGSDIVPVEVTIYIDRTFDMVFKTAPASDLLRKAAGVEKGSGTPHTAKVGKISNLPLQVIDSPFYKSLKIYGALPIIADSLGRTNPFIPY